MALSAKHRSMIYEKLSPAIGEEETEALLSQFPTSELDEPITKDFVRAEIAELRTELHAEIAELRVDLLRTTRGQTMWLTGLLVTILLAMLALSATNGGLFG